MAMISNPLRAMREAGVGGASIEMRAKSGTRPPHASKRVSKFGAGAPRGSTLPTSPIVATPLYGGPVPQAQVLAPVPAPAPVPVVEADPALTSIQEEEETPAYSIYPWEVRACSGVVCVYASSSVQIQIDVAGSDNVCVCVCLTPPCLWCVQVGYSEDGHPYWYNHETGESTWEDPASV
jgi:hypothetical protein